MPRDHRTHYHHRPHHQYYAHFQKYPYRCTIKCYYEFYYTLEGHSYVFYCHICLSVLPEMVNKDEYIKLKMILKINKI